MVARRTGLVRSGSARGCRPMIPIAMPLLDVDEAEAARDVVLSGWVSQGPQVAAFEREFSALTGAPHASAVCNCTAALHLALVTLNIGPGDEVITASHSFIATANCIRYCGAIPIFVDIDPQKHKKHPDPVFLLTLRLARP